MWGRGRGQTRKERDYVLVAEQIKTENLKAELSNFKPLQADYACIKKVQPSGGLQPYFNYTQ